MLFVTELFQRLGNGHANEKTSRATKSKPAARERSREPASQSGSRDCAPAVGTTQTLVNSCIISGL